MAVGEEKKRLIKSVKVRTKMISTVLLSTQKVNTTSTQALLITQQVVPCRTKWELWWTKMESLWMKMNSCCKNLVNCITSWKLRGVVNAWNRANIISRRQLRSKRKTSRRNLKRMTRVKLPRVLPPWPWKKPAITIHTSPVFLGDLKNETTMTLTAPNLTTRHKCWPLESKAVWMCSRIRLISEMGAIVLFQIQTSPRPLN